MFTFVWERWRFQDVIWYVLSPLLQPLFSCSLLHVQWQKTRWHLTLWIALSLPLFGFKVNHLPEVKEENGLVTSFPSPSDFRFSLRSPYTGFLVHLLLFWSLKWAFICLEHKWWTWQDLLMMKLLEAGVLDVKLGSLSRVFFSALCQWSSLPTYADSLSPPEPVSIFAVQFSSVSSAEWTVE